jgi:hypothetical protein
MVSVTKYNLKILYITVLVQFIATIFASETGGFPSSNSDAVSRIYPGQNFGCADNIVNSFLYYDVLTFLCEKALAGSASVARSSKTWSLLANSKVCFETLVRLYYLRHGLKAATVFSFKICKFLHISPRID